MVVSKLLSLLKQVLKRMSESYMAADESDKDISGMPKIRTLKKWNSGQEMPKNLFDGPETEP